MGNRLLVIRVSNKTNLKKLAGYLADVIRQQGKAEIQVIGAGALNQAVKAIAIARGYLAPQGIDLVMRPSFMNTVIEGQERTVLRLMLEPKSPMPT